jgi:hypothetical protein
MPGGECDSLKTRAVPVFDRLQARGDDWVRELLNLARYGSGAAVPTDVCLSFTAGYWGSAERALDPPVALLSWQIRNLAPPVSATHITEERARLLAGDTGTIATALGLLRSAGTGAAWHVFEGPSYPDAYIETPGALVVIEGKRTEHGPTTHTTWMGGRHQIWRHIDAAWEVRGRRAVFGLLLVEGAHPDPFEVPAVWQEAAASALSAETLRCSFPHRGVEERAAIAQGFLGVATWQAVCRRFVLDFGALPKTTAELRA